MSFLTNKELGPLLKKSISEGKFKEERLQNASYELTLGDEVYTNNDETKTILSSTNPQFEIRPGQFAVLITNEEISITQKHIGFISLKFGFKFRGLVNISGFHVDPGFKGKLKFSVYNAGSQSIILDRGAPYFVLWISELKSDLDEKNLYNGTHQGQNSINANDIMKIKGEIASPNGLLEQIRALETRIETESEWRRWGLRIIIGLLIALVVKMLWDWGDYKRGYSDAVQHIKSKNIESTNLIEKINEQTEKKVEKMFKVKMDSLNSVNSTFENSKDSIN